MGKEKIDPSPPAGSCRRDERFLNSLFFIFIRGLMEKGGYEKPSFSRKLLAGLMSGTVASVLTNPVEVVKV